MNWNLKPVPPEHEEQTQRLRRQFNLHPLLSHLLSQRGLIKDEEVQRFLYGTLSDLPDPFLLNDMDRAVERLIEAYQKKQKVLFFGDYDVDGITGSAQLQVFSREIGLQTEVLLPHRLHEGYGLTQKSVQKILAKKPDLLVTIDNGTNAFDEVTFLKEHGIDVIIIDHHEAPAEDRRSPAIAIVNPKSIGSRFQERDIASAGLVFLFLMAFRARCRERGITPLPNLKRYLDLACLGTIADIVPLTGTNRLLVKYGLEELGATTRPGLRELINNASVRTPINTGSVAFRLAPRINAAGRLSDPTIALELLTSEKQEKASLLASRLEELNHERQKIEEAVLQEAITMVGHEPFPKGIVVASTNWHLGVVGIVASKLTERFGRPAVVLSLSEDGQEAKGSARTIPGLSIYKVLKKIEGEMTRFGGHTAAAGMTLKAENLKNFTEKFDRSVSEEWDENKGGHLRGSKLQIDSVLPLIHINTALVKELSLLEPHGLGNPEPLFMTSKVSFESCRIVGKNHLKALLCQDGARVDSIGFDWGHYLETASKKVNHDIAFSPSLNQWNGYENLQIKIKSIYTTD